MFKKRKEKLLITGGSGFIATHLIKYLQTFDKYEITVLDIVPPKAENVKFIQASISELTKIESILNNIDCVFNFATMIGVDNCAKNPDAVMQVNYVDTKNFFDLCVKKRIKKIIFTSSSEVYGNSEDIPYKEDAMLQPISTYAKCKMMIENYLMEISRTTKIKVGIVRFFNVYGPGQKEDFVSSIFVKAALTDKPLFIFGDGQQSRCFTYVGDAVKGVYSLFKYNKSSYEIVNIGSKFESTIEGLAKIILSSIPESKSKIVFKNYGIDSVRESYLEIKRRIPATDKARKLFDFEATTNIQDGIKNIALSYVKGINIHDYFKDGRILSSN